MVLLIHFSMEAAAEEKFLRDLVRTAATPEAFCQSHLLARRNRISRKRSRLVRAYFTHQLPAFHFLISLN